MLGNKNQPTNVTKMNEHLNVATSVCGLCISEKTAYRSVLVLIGMFSNVIGIIFTQKYYQILTETL